jgi:hypothetical protein
MLTGDAEFTAIPVVQAAAEEAEAASRRWTRSR